MRVPFDKLFEAVEPCFPSPQLLTHPAFRLGKGLRLKTASPYASALFASDQTARFEQLQVLEHGRQAHSQWLGKVAYRSRATAQPRKHATPRRVA
jgi:hypothetical protein